MATKSKTRKAPASRAVAIPDPIFALIDDHNAAEKDTASMTNSKPPSGGREESMETGQ